MGAQIFWAPPPLAGWWLPADVVASWPVEGVPRAVVSGLAVFGVPVWSVLDPGAFAFAVECAVAAAVDEAFGWLGLVPVDVVGFEWCAVEVFGGVPEHRSRAVFAFCSVYEVVEQVFTWDLLLPVSVPALCCCGLLLFGLEVVVVELDCPAFGFELGGEPFSECDAAVSACAAGDGDGGWL